jgi:hypothetical protein
VLERLRELRGGGPAAAAQLRTLASAPLAPPLVVLWWSRMCSCAPHRLGRRLAVASLAWSTVVGARWRVAASVRLSLAWGGRRRGTDSDPPCLVSAPLGLRPRHSRIAAAHLSHCCQRAPRARRRPAWRSPCTPCLRGDFAARFSGWRPLMGERARANARACVRAYASRLHARSRMA